MEPLNLMWLEEPVPAENVDADRLIAQETSAPICAGENINLADGFRRLLETGGVDIVMPDLQKAGGLGERHRRWTEGGDYHGLVAGERGRLHAGGATVRRESTKSTS